MPLYKDGAFLADEWRHVADDEPLPETGGAIVSWQRWQASRANFGPSNHRFGVKIGPEEAIDDLEADALRLALIALSFPKFSDGRNYSRARAIRERFGFKGELRAVGDVLLDQLPLMLRCGFDAFDIGNAATIKALERGHLPMIEHLYQRVGNGNAASPRARVPVGSVRNPWAD